MASATDQAVQAVRDKWSHMIRERPKKDRGQTELLAIVAFAFMARLHDGLKETVPAPAVEVPGQPTVIPSEEMTAEERAEAARDVVRRVGASVQAEWLPEAALNDLQAQYGRVIRGIIGNVQSGSVPPDSAVLEFADEVRRAFAEAYTFGKAHGGWPAKPQVDVGESEGILLRAGQEAEYFRDLADAALDPDRRGRVSARIEAYVHKLWGEYQRGIVAALGDVALDWILDPQADHCADCPRLTMGSPYTKDTLPTVPGAGDTQCLSQCRCRIVEHKLLTVPWAEDSSERALAALQALTAKKMADLPFVLVRGDRGLILRKQQPLQKPQKWVTVQGKRIPITQGGPQQGGQQAQPQAAQGPPQGQPAQQKTPPQPAPPKMYGERWVTITDPSSPMYGRPVFLGQRRSGRASVITGAPGLAHLQLAERKEQQFTPEQQALVEERRQIHTLNADKMQTMREKQAEIDQTWQETLGVQKTLTDAEREKVRKQAEEVAKKKGLEGDAAAKFAEREERFQEAERQKQFRDTVKQAERQATMIVTSEDPEQAAKTLAEETELVKQSAAVRGVRGHKPLGAAIFDAPPTRQLEPQETEDSAADVPGANALIGPKEKVLVQLTAEKALEVRKLALEEKRVMFGLKRELAKIPEGVKLGELAQAEQFRVNMQAMTDEDVRKYELEKQARTVQAKLTAALMNSVDEQWESKAGGYSVQDGIARGALDAFNGIASKFIGGSFVDEKVVGILGIEATAQMLANRLLESGMDPADLDKQLTQINEEFTTEIGQKALDRAQELRAENAMYIEQATQQVLDEDGNVVRDTMLSRSRANRLITENEREVLRHIGTAAGSLQAAASALYLVKRGKVQKTVELALPDMESANELQHELRLKGMTKEQTAQGVQVKIPESQLRKYLTTPTPKGENATFLEGLARGEGGFAKDYKPSGFRSTIAGEEARSVQLREPQRRAVSWLVANGGGVLGLEVGAGKTLTALAFFGNKADTEGAKKMLYVAPGASLQGQVADETKRFTQYGAKMLHGGKTDTLDAIRSRYQGDEQVHIGTFQQVAKDVSALKELGVDVGGFFRDLGYDMTVIDEAHLTTNTSGGGKIGRGLRQINTKYRVAMTGTPARKNVVEAVDLVRWTNPGKLSSRAGLRRKYGEVGLGTNGWHGEVAKDVNRMLSPYLYSGGADITAKAIRHNERVTMTEAQRSALAQIEKDTQAKRREATRGATGAGERRRAIQGVEAERERKVYDVLRDGSHTENAAVTRTQEVISRHLSSDPSAKFVIFVDGQKSAAPLDALEDMLSSLGKGEVVRLSGRDRSGSAISQQKVKRNTERFNTDDGVRFVIATQRNSQGRNMSRADVGINFDLPTDAASGVQREGRPLRPDRVGDVTFYNIVYGDNESDLRQLRALERSGAALEAVTGGK